MDDFEFVFWWWVYWLVFGGFGFSAFTNATFAWTSWD